MIPAYPYQIETLPQGDLVGRWVDWPKADPEKGRNAEELHQFMQESLALLLRRQIARRRDLPPPSAPTASQRLCRVGVVVSAKLLLLRHLLLANLSQSELAKRLEVNDRQARRLVSVQESASLDLIERALAELGWSMELRLKPAGPPPAPKSRSQAQPPAP